MFVPLDWLFSPETKEESIYIDKIIHTLVFVFLVLWFSGQVKMTLRFFVIMSCYGGIIEFVQFYLPYRSFEWLDLFFNQIGILSGIIIGEAFLKEWSLNLEELISKYR
jgi:VanZ family protein